MVGGGSSGTGVHSTATVPLSLYKGHHCLSSFVLICPCLLSSPEVVGSIPVGCTFSQACLSQISRIIVRIWLLSNLLSSKHIAAHARHTLLWDQNTHGQFQAGPALSQQSKHHPTCQHSSWCPSLWKPGRGGTYTFVGTHHMCMLTDLNETHITAIAQMI